MDHGQTPADRLYRDAELVDFYDLENEGGADFEYCVALAKEAGSVLDLGCGTGLLAAALAKGRQVTGVDPAPAMLDVARKRPGTVEWIEADARSVRLGRTFDLVMLTGHAFQVFLTENDRRSVLETIALHLSPNGRFIFDTRNPARQEWLEWTPAQSQRQLFHPRHGDVRAWNDVRRDSAEAITYWTFYEIADARRTLSAQSQIAFPAKAGLEELISGAGLVAEQWLGDWHGTPHADTSPEIIPIGRLA
ncbi:class I SAM-dependent methyltransferase [Mesorhizobium sp. A556]